MFDLLWGRMGRSRCTRLTGADARTHAQTVGRTITPLGAELTFHRRHDITGELVKKLHYTKDYELTWRQLGRLPQWQKEWDTYYDAQAASSSVVETESK